MKTYLCLKTELWHPYSEMARSYEAQSRRDTAYRANYFADNSYPIRPAKTVAIS